MNYQTRFCGEKFEKHFGIHSIRIQGEFVLIDHEATETYFEKIQNIIAEQGYTADQVFDVDEAGLWWRKIPVNPSSHKLKKLHLDLRYPKIFLCSNALATS